MFKPVSGAALDGYDEETINLYRKRANDPRTDYLLSVVPRQYRHNLPVVCDTSNNSHLQKLERDHKKWGWQLAGLYVWFSKFPLYYTNIHLLILYFNSYCFSIL